ncbi:MULTISPECIES: hypothetical protein [unclassified Kitasatospora]|uniref:hypothetical protein n=1 Tax=unclassified Kitasatospora TaxID=2633591 RepID=UPI002E358E0F|nr:hypothetical protein [Kitasatospora sp. NBC_01246]
MNAMAIVRRIAPAAVVLSVTLLVAPAVSLIDAATGARGGAVTVAMNNGWD